MVIQVDSVIAAGAQTVVILGGVWAVLWLVIKANVLPEITRLIEAHRAWDEEQHQFILERVDEARQEARQNAVETHRRIDAIATKGAAGNGPG